MENFDKKIILDDGTQFYGYSFGAEKDCVTEIVFNTSMVGYQEIISDPSYKYQAVVMSYPLIGNYGVNGDDYESEKPAIDGLIVRDYNDTPSNFRADKTLSKVMKTYGVTGVCGVDTRSLVRHIRDHGSQRCLITSVNTSVEEGLKIIKNTPVQKDAVRSVTCDNIHEYPADGDIRIVAIDCGMKQNIVRSLNKRGATVIVVPYGTTAEEIIALRPDGVFISNGPGDPEDAYLAIDAVKKLRGKYPMLGICLGHQIIALSYGAKTYKLKFGHRGGNHPVKNVKTGKIEITSQNHSYAVDLLSLQNTPLSMTHINLLDGTVEGAECEKDKVFCVQYHPESAPGPEDSGYLFDKFIALIKENKNA